MGVRYRGVLAHPLAWVQAGYINHAADQQLQGAQQVGAGLELSVTKPLSTFPAIVEGDADKSI